MIDITINSDGAFRVYNALERLEARDEIAKEYKYSFRHGAVEYDALSDRGDCIREKREFDSLSDMLQFLGCYWVNN